MVLRMPPVTWPRTLLQEGRLRLMQHATAVIGTRLGDHTRFDSWDCPGNKPVASGDDPPGSVSQPVDECAEKLQERVRRMLITCAGATQIHNKLEPK